jgi:hypothetical protein
MRLGKWAAAAAVLALAACDQLAGAAGGPAIPPTPQGAQAPVVLEGGPTGQINQITAEQRTQFEGQVRGFMDQYQAQFAQGMTASDALPEQIVTLQANADHRWYVNLAGGTTYRFIAGCDQDCTNVDFELIAPQGGVVASDLLPDDYPIAEYTPAEDGRYIARVIMRTCTTAPCFTALRTYQQAPSEAGGDK